MREPLSLFDGPLVARGDSGPDKLTLRFPLDVVVVDDDDGDGDDELFRMPNNRGPISSRRRKSGDEIGDVSRLSSSSPLCSCSFSGAVA